MITRPTARFRGIAQFVVAVAIVVFHPSAAATETIRFSIVSEPAGANVEWNGRLVGTTPYTADIEDWAFKSPKWPWSKFLGEFVVRTWKDGFLPKSLAVTSGPFEWINLNNTVRKIYYVVEPTSVTVLLERDPRGTPDPPEVFSSSSPANGSIATGTGFILSASGYIATNFHVVSGATRLEIRVPGAVAPLSAVTVVKDIRNDLAILKAEGLQTTSTPIAFAESSPVRVGQDAYTLGFPLGTLMGSTVRLSTGSIDSLFGMEDDPRVYQISNPVQPGNSGGPLFNKDGQLIGVVVAQLDAKTLYEAAGIIPQNINFAVKSSLLRNLIDTLPDGAEIGKRSNGMEGALREEQVAELSPLVVQIIAYEDTVTAPVDRFFGRGSTLDEVLSVQGIPNYQGTVSVRYGDATVFFSQGRVMSWHDPSHILKVR